MVVIETFGLTKKFGDLVAVDHINIKIREGEIFGLLGPNGAGKTTTIHMLATILRPTEGTAVVAGYDIRKDPQKIRERIGIVFQETTIDRNLTGFENMWIYGRLYGLSGGVLRDKIMELLRYVELGRWKDVPIKKYSGGMIRRLEIARGLLNEPEILFLDEPTLGLDPQTRVHIWDYIKKIKKERDITILLTTHYLEEADMLCDRLAIIDYGKIIALDRPEKLKEMVSGDIIYIKLKKDAMPIREFIFAIEKNLGGNPKVIEGPAIMINVPDAPSAIPKIFEIANQMGIVISELKYNHPSLNDVFIKLTGRSIREEMGSWMNIMRIRMMARMRRRR